MQIIISPPARGATGPYRRKVNARIAGAAGRATDRAAFGARDEIRAAMRQQRLGNLANAIAATSDIRKKRPGGRAGRGLDIAGFVYARVKSPRTAGALASYLDNDATEIGPKGGRYLWIATNEIPRRVGRKRMTPALYRATQESKFGPLQFIRGKTAGEAFYVINQVSLRIAAPGKLKGVGPSGRVGRGRAKAGIIAFIGIRRTRRQRRVAPRQIAQRWQRQLGPLFGEELSRNRGA